MDSVKENIIIGGSLDEKFASRLAASAVTYSKSNAVKLIGMPNWDGFEMVKKNALKDFPVYFTSPYHHVKWDPYSRRLKDVYTKKYKGLPSDMAYKGFEMIMLFSRLITKYPNDFMSHLNDHSPKIFTDYNFKPVFLRKQATSPDYFENKHLYFIKLMNGTATRAW